MLRKAAVPALAILFVAVIAIHFANKAYGVTPDPAMDATCIAEPNAQPQCTQGTERVSITLGSPCHVPGSGMIDQSWQYTYSGSEDVRCMLGRLAP